MTDLTPREIVSELDASYIGQPRPSAPSPWPAQPLRRKQLPPELARKSIPRTPDDRPTGVGKTEISRRLAKLARAPFIKIEATKFTEVG